MLYPQANEIRMTSKLDGMWKFSNTSQVDLKKPLTHAQLMAVPASFNDQTLDKQLSDYVGTVWYERNFAVQPETLQKRLVLRFGAVTHQAKVYINGQFVGQHVGGFTPFEFTINDYVQVGINDLKVAVSNILDNTTLPSAAYDEKTNHLEPRFDFYNYSGIHRPAVLYTTNFTYIDTFDINYQLTGEQAVVTPSAEIVGPYDQAMITYFDEDEVLLGQSSLGGSFMIDKPKRWNVMDAHLYAAEIKVYQKGQLLDTYRQEFGLRTIKVEDGQFYLNDKPVYFKGFGRHEDFIASGRGENLALTNLDFNIMKNLGANSFRTSHYPYSEEEMMLADKRGFLVIDEVAAVGLYNDFSVNTGISQTDSSTWQVLQTGKAHKQALKELVERDKNHPSVVMWSLANEPAGQQEGAYEYFKPLFEYMRTLDDRPLTVVNISMSGYQLDKVSSLCDVLCLNRYYGWYVDNDDLTKAKQDLAQDIEGWHELYPNKPIIFTEFGADTIYGKHSLYHEPYSEEYQWDYYEANFQVFDKYDYVVGEQLWNFADFKTSPSLIRVMGNNKGVFTRERQPKMVVKLLQKRWHKQN